MYPRFLQLIIRKQVGDLSTHTTKYTSPALTQKVFANMRRVGKGFFGVETPLFEGMLVEQEIEEEGDTDEHVEEVTAGDDAHGDDSAAHGEVPTVTQKPSIPSPTPPTPPPQPPQDVPSTSQVHQTPPQSPQVQPSSPQPQPQPQQATKFPMSFLQEALDACATLTRRLEHLEYDKVAQALEIKKLKKRMKKLEKRNKVRVLRLRRLQRVGTSQRVDTSDDTMMDDKSNQGSMIAEMNKDDAVVLMDDMEEDKKVKKAKVDESAQVHGRQAESQAKIYKIDMDHANKVLSMQEDKTEPAEVQEVVDVVTTAKLITKVVTVSSETVTAARVVIKDPKSESATSTIIPAETKSKDKGKRILVEEPKPLKKKQQIEQDEQYSRELHVELNKDINWDEAIDHVKRKAKEDPAVKRYQVLKRKPQTEAQARKNMIMYLKIVAGFKMDYFKGMSYDDIPEVQEVVDVVTTAKLITKVVTVASETVTAASAIIPTAEPSVPAATLTAAPARVLQAFYTEKSPILPPIITPPASMLNPQEFFLPEEFLSPKKQGHNQSSSSTSTLSQAFEIGESSRLGQGRVIIQQDFDALEAELQQARAQITKLQRKKMGSNHKISLACFMIANLEQTLKDIQAHHQVDMENL
nr:hypothetical protein [Tanacetum cinerariifolium]